MNRKPQPCPHRNEIERIHWRRVLVIAKAMRKDGRTVPRGAGCTRTVRAFLLDFVRLYGSRWKVEVNAYVASMEQQHWIERKVA